MYRWQNILAERTSSMNASEIKEMFKLAENDEIISFAGGFPSVEAFEPHLVVELINKIMSENSNRALQYSPTGGVSELRVVLAEELGKLGIKCGPENILVTSGSQQGLDLVFKLFINPGDRIVVEKPSYMGAIGAMNSYQAELVGVEIDAEGICPVSLDNTLSALQKVKKQAKLIYLIPNFSNPSGVTMSQERRKKVLELAVKYDLMILEDNPYKDINFGNELPASLKALDGEERVIYMGSFSKSFVPGIKIGWICAPQELIELMTNAKQNLDLCTNSLGQYLALYYMREGYLKQHLASLSSLYKGKRDILLDAFSKYFPQGVTWTVPQGGFFSFVTVPKRINTKNMLEKALQRGVAYVPGHCFFADNSGYNTMRMAFSEVKTERIDEGIRRLAEVIKEELV